MRRVLYAKAVYGTTEKNKVLKVLKNSHTLIAGPETIEFEENVALLNGKKYGVMVNSGSSANLLAIELLNLPRGSEVITPALTFATTVAPLIQKGLVPVFCDVRDGYFTIDEDKIEELITPRTRALMIPLLLGNVPNMKKLRRIANKHNIYLIDDSCDTLGASYGGRPVGTYSDITTTSFYASHIITAGGNGGMIMVNKKKWYDRARMLRGWGRSSSLFSESEDIKKRFSKKLDGQIYDGKFIFTEVGYNMWPHEMGSAFGNAQLARYVDFYNARRSNFKQLYEFFKGYEEFELPIEYPDTYTAWLAFPILTKFPRLSFVKYLETHNIQTRPIFTGNILKQPAFSHLKGKSYPITEKVMKQGVLIGCHQGLSQKDINHIKKTVIEYLLDSKKKRV